MPADRLIIVNVEAEGTRNDMGEYVPGPVTAIRTWANRRDRFADDIETEGGQIGSTRWDWRIRWDKRIASTPVFRMSVFDGGVFFDVLNMVEVHTRTRGNVTPPALWSFKGCTQHEIPVD